MSAAASGQPPDLSNAAKACASLMAHLPMERSDRLANLISTIRSLALGGSWRLRGGILPFMAILAYRSQYVEPCSAHTAALRATLHSLVCDPQHEVREVSAAVLGGFIRLHGHSERTLTLKWARQRTRKGRPHTERHAGVLALVALVQLAPYDVPTWLPEVLELLATFHNDAQPIKGAVSQVPTFACHCRIVPCSSTHLHTHTLPCHSHLSCPRARPRLVLSPTLRAFTLHALHPTCCLHPTCHHQAFADFKRTHQDNWAKHRERFTPDQQDLISDMLVMPSFYA